MEKVEKYPRLSKTMAGRLHQLRLKKHRDERGVFVAEGGKCVGDTLGHFELVSLVATEKWFAGRPHVDGEVFLAGSDQNAAGLVAEHCPGGAGRLPPAGI